MNQSHGFVSAALLAAFLVFIPQQAPAQAPEGTVLFSFDSTTFGVGLGFDGQFLYVPDGIDANQLLLFDTTGAPQGTLGLDCVIGNLSYDATRNLFWAGNMLGSSTPIYTIDPSTGQCTLQFDALATMTANGACGMGFCSWPFDGIDYDERDDTLRISPDGSTIVYNFNLDGTLASSFGPIDTTAECGFDFSSGVATGQSNILYSATDGCDEIFKWDKDTGTKLGHFGITAERNEAIECDNVTFRGSGNDGVWIKDLNGPIQAFAVPEDTCEIIPEPRVVIDIKPGSDPNSINTGNNGLIPVAILTTEDFDALTVDADSVRFGPDEAEKSHKRAHVEDVDGEGDLDLLLHFRTRDTGIAPGDTEACLTGETLDGVPIMGCDSVRTVPPKGKKK